jgi:hypothetical protein
MTDDEDDASTTSCSMDICDVEVPMAPEATPCHAVHFHSSFSENNISNNSNHSNKDSYYIPLEKVGKNYRHLARRRGAAVQSQLLKNAFEASMSSYEFSDNSDKADDYSMHASNSTLASRDGIEDIPTVPRKRSRRNGDNDGTTATANTSSGSGHLFWGHGIEIEATAKSTLHPQRGSVTGVSTQGSSVFTGGGGGMIQQQMATAADLTATFDPHHSDEDHPIRGY